MQRSMRGDRVSNVASTFAPNMIGDAFSGGASRLDIQVPVRLQFGEAGTPLDLSTAGTPLTASGFGVPFRVLINDQPVDMSAAENLRNEFGFYPGLDPISSFSDAQLNLDPSVTAGDIQTDPTVPLQDPADPASPHYARISSEEAYVRSQLEPYGYDFTYDFLSSSHVQVTATGQSPQGIANLDYLVSITGPEVILPNPGAGGTVGRVKIAENTSPIPRDRLIFDYNLFHNVPLYTDFPVNRFTPGFEKTFFNGIASVEMRFPMAITLPQSVDLRDELDYTALYEFGNMSVTPKVLLLQRETWALSLGMSVFLPTAQDLRVTWYDGTDVIHVDNQSVNLAPFVGGLWMPNNFFYMQGFLQYSIDTNGCPVSVDLFTPSAISVGRIYDGTNQYVDIAAGLWLYQNPYAGCIRRIAWQNEIHWNYSLRAPTIARANNFTIGRPDVKTDQWNLTTGLVAELRNNWSVSLAFATPVSSSFREYDGELRLAVNKFFGKGTSSW